MKAEILVEVKKEIQKMLDAGFIRPCRYAEWISNVVPVEKKDGRWRVAIDFRNLNSATPKDEYPMPVAETLINAAAGHKVLSFMDGNAGYNQIFMAPEDINKTAFRVPGSVGLFEYVVMTFGLKNAGATYQRAMNYIFHDLIGKLVEIYIDDVVVKSVSVDGHLEDLRHVLDRTRKFGLRMNPKKCAFGVTAGQFLGFLVHERGIEIGLKSQEAVRTMKPPTTKKELQCLIGKINFVRRFISNLSGRIESFMGLVLSPDFGQIRRWAQHILARPVGPSGQSSAATTSTSASEMAEEPIKYEDLPAEHKKKYDDLKAILEADLIGSFERTRSHGIKFKGFQPEGALEGLDLSLPSEERTRALRQEVNYVVAHSLHRHSESLVNTLERVALNVVQEIMKHKYSPSGPALGTHQGEIPLYTRPPLPYTMAAPQQQGSPAYVVYKVGGDPGDYQFLYEPPKEIPHGYVCTYVSDCNNWMSQVTAGRTATAGGVAGTGGRNVLEQMLRKAWLAKYATGTSHELSTLQLLRWMRSPERQVRHPAEEENDRLF
ncbi:hypothetical protein QYE76_032603 [Lolium multiflorum]|uniref:Reverse transcriptase domain-containing protein n=1 Tax=Lolium multiflorum TaxID=4521 RepID=A0AAD8VLB4_LOLMU|nr:hypothetical protein QYE76_032603 [Lolium multiflorum]